MHHKKHPNCLECFCIVIPDLIRSHLNQVQDDNRLCAFLLSKAVSAQNWTIAFRLERNCVLFTTVGTSNLERLSWTTSESTSVVSHSSFFSCSTRRTPFWRVGKPFLLVEFLL